MHMVGGSAVSLVLQDGHRSNISFSDMGNLLDWLVCRLSKNFIFPSKIRIEKWRSLAVGKLSLDLESCANGIFGHQILGALNE